MSSGPSRCRWREGIVALCLLLAFAATANAQPVLATWNPLYSVGDWDWFVPFNPTPFWLEVPSDPFEEVGPHPGTPPNNSQWLYIVNISNSHVNLSTFKTITSLNVDADAELLLDAGMLTVLTAVANSATIQINALGSLTTPLFENFPMGELHLTTLGELNTVVLENHASIIGDTAGVIIAGAINNYEDGVITAEFGTFLLSTGVVNNDGEIRVELPGAELVATLSSLTLTGGGFLILGDDGASVTSLATINNLGDHTIRGHGTILAGVLTNAATIRSDDFGETLNIAVGAFDNSGKTFALGGTQLDIQASGVTNSGLIEASEMSRIDIDASSLDNSGTNPTPNDPPMEPLHEGTGIRAIDNSIIKIVNPQIDNNGGLIEARENSQVQFEKVDLEGGLLYADDTSILTVTDSQSFMNNIRLDGLLQVQPGGYLNLYNTVDIHDSELNVQPGGHVDFEYGTITTLIGGLVNGGGTISKEYYTQLTLDATNGMQFDDFTMTVYPGGFLRLQGHLTNNATIQLYNDGILIIDPTLFQIDGDATIDGNGSIVFLDVPNKNRIVPVNPGDTLTQDVDHTIRTDGPGTWGQITVDLINHGTVDSDGGTIWLTSANVRNDGVIRASNGGFLSVSGDVIGNVLDNTDGVVEAIVGGNTWLTNLLVIDGTLAGDSVIDIGGVTTLQSSEMHITGHVRVGNTQSLVLQGDFTNDGLIESTSSAGFQSRIYVDGEVTLDGNGTLAFTSNIDNFLFPRNAGGDRLIQMADHTITTMNSGSDGHITVDLTNYGTVDADDGFLDLSIQDIVNRGLMQSSNGGTLSIVGVNGLVDNLGGTIRAGAGSQVWLTNLTLTGGIIDGEGLVIPANVILDSSVDHIVLDANIYMDWTHRMRLVGDFTNTGNIRITDTQPGGGMLGSLDAFLTITDEVTLEGTGDIRFTTQFGNHINAYNSNPNARLIQGADHTIKTLGDGSQGSVELSLTNYGLVDADNGIITLSGINNVNHGILQARNGGTLWIAPNSAATLPNEDGVIYSFTGSTVNLVNVTIVGGSIEGDGLVLPANAVLDGSGILLDTNFYMDYVHRMRLVGDITNNGTIRLTDTHSNGTSGFNSILTFTDELDLDGDGQIIFTTIFQNILAGFDANARLIHHADHSIRTVGEGSQGFIDVNFTNFGLIEADDGILNIRSTDNVNRGMIRSINGGSLNISAFSPAVMDNDGGTIYVDAASSVLLGNNTIIGGHLDGDGYFTVQGNTTYEGSTPAGPVLVDANTYIGWAGLLRLRGDVTNNGRMLIADPDFGGQESRLLPDGPVMLDGIGYVEFSGPYTNRIRGFNNNAPTDRLILGADHSVRALGADTQALLEVNITNHGDILIDDATLFFSSLDVVNTGTIRAVNAATVWLGASPMMIVDNQDGEIYVDATSGFVNSGVTIEGGRLYGEGSFYIQGTNGFDGSTASGPVTLDAITYVGWHARLTMKGDSINNNRMIFSNPQDGTQSIMLISGPVLIDGTGSMEMGPSPFQHIIQSAGVGAQLTVGPQQLLTSPMGANNHISVPLVLNGTMGADGGVFVLNNPITNNGTFRATNGSFQQFFYANGGTGGWLADGGRLYFNVGAHPTTTGPITAVNGGIINYNSNNVTGSDLFIDENLSMIVTAGTTNIRLTGDFEFATTDETYWYWEPGTSLHMLGGVGASLPPEVAGNAAILSTLDAFADWAAMEIGGFDIGIDPDNHVGDPTGFVNTNFFIPNLVIGLGAHVYLQDLLDNGHRGGPFGQAEALYVNTLTFADAEAMLNLNGLHLYYLNLVGSASQIVDVEVPEPMTVTLLGMMGLSLALRRR